MNKNRVEVFIKLLSLGIVISTVIGICILPQEVPIHFGIKGEATSYGSKYVDILIGLILLSLVVSLYIYTKRLMNKVSKIQLKKDRDILNKNIKIYHYIILIIALFFNIYNIYIIRIQYNSAKNADYFLNNDINKFILIFIGSLLLVLGNIIHKSEINSVLGVRTKWSMKNELSWKDTQRFSRVILVISGILLIAGAFIFNRSLALLFMLIIIVICTAITYIMSYFFYKRSIK